MSSNLKATDIPGRLNVSVEGGVGTVLHEISDREGFLRLPLHVGGL